MMRSRELLVAFWAFGVSGAAGADLAVNKAAPSAVWAPTVTAYSLLDIFSFRNAFPGHEYRSHGYQGTVGLNYTLTPQWTLGGGLIYNHANSDLTYFGPGAQSRSEGLTGSINTAYTIPDLFTLGGSAGYGKAWTHQTRTVAGVQSLGDYDTAVRYASVYVSKSLKWGNLYVTPALRVLGRESKADAYVESLGLVNPASTSVLGEFTYGSQFSYAIPMSSGWTLYPTAEIFGIYDFRLPLYQSNKNGLDLKAGLSATVGSWSMGATYMTILGIDAYRDYHGVRFFLSRAFGAEASPPRQDLSYTYLRPSANYR